MWCKIKADVSNEITGLGRLGDLTSTPDGRNVVALSLHGIPRVKESFSHYSGDPLITTGRIFTMALRNKIRSRDYMGNSSHHDFDYWCDLQTRLIGILSSCDGEDYVNMMWENLNHIIDTVSITMPLYSLAKIVFSFKDNEIFFIGDYGESGNQYVEIINKDFRSGHQNSRLSSITHALWESTPNGCPDGRGYL